MDFLFIILCFCSFLCHLFILFRALSYPLVLCVLCIHTNVPYRTVIHTKATYLYSMSSTSNPIQAILLIQTHKHNENNNSNNKCVAEMIVLLFWFNVIDLSVCVYLFLCFGPFSLFFVIFLFLFYFFLLLLFLSSF